MKELEENDEMTDQKIVEKLEKDIERVQKRSKNVKKQVHRKPIISEDSE